MSQTFLSDTFDRDGILSHSASFIDSLMSSNNSCFGQSSSMSLNNNDPYRTSVLVQRQQNAWPVPETPTDAYTPTADKLFDPFPQDYDSSPPGIYQSMHMDNNSYPFEWVPITGDVRHSAVFPSAQPDNSPVLMSVHADKEWMKMSAMEKRSVPKRMRPSKPRRSGIRKKKARTADIPSKRNLLNLDQEIVQCTDPEELKELKQQKRMLRNRQAAYEYPLSFSPTVHCSLCSL